MMPYPCANMPDFLQPMVLFLASLPPFGCLEEEERETGLSLEGRERERERGRRKERERESDGLLVLACVSE